MTAASVYPFFDRMKYDGKTIGIVVDSHLHVKGGGRGAAFIPVVEYQYEVGEKTFENDCYSVWDDHGNKAWATKTVGDNSPGTKCHVYYIVDEPNVSVLRLSPTEPAIGFFWSSVIMLAMFLLAWRGFCLQFPIVHDETRNKFRLAFDTSNANGKSISVNQDTQIKQCKR
jgi:hypothetical protein